MKAILLGTTGYHPNDIRQTACVMLPEIGLVFDAGTGMYRVRDHLRTSHLDIFLSHAHLDHVVGLTFLFDVLFGKSMDRVCVHGEAEKLATIREHLFTPLLFPVDPPYEDVPLTEPVAVGGGGELSFFPLKHPGGSVGFRVNWPDHSLAYVTDTTASPDADYIDHIRGVDVLIHECYFSDEWKEQAEKTGHSCATPVAQVAQRADVGRLILVHLNPMMLNDDPIGVETARAIFPNTELGFDGMELELGE